ncbi:hypothetical protein BGZ95_005157, partial [Linnemannia exigua]
MSPAAATATALDNEPRWRIKKLTVDWVFVSLLAKCPGLQHLSFVYPVVKQSRYMYIASQSYLLPMMLERMANLETISILHHYLHRQYQRGCRTRSFVKVLRAG